PRALASRPEQPAAPVGARLLGDLGRDCREILARPDPPERGLRPGARFGAVLVRAPALRDDHQMPDHQLVLRVAGVAGAEPGLVQPRLTDRDLRSQPLEEQRLALPFNERRADPLQL